MAGRPQIFNEAEVLEKATNVFWAKGYEATSTEDLMAAMGIGKSSFYNSFKGKRELFELVIDKFINHSIAQLHTNGDPLTTIKNFFRSIATTPNTVHQKGCFMGNIIVELSNIDKPLENLAIKRLKKLEQLFFELLTNAGLDDAPTKARYLMTMWNGLNITRRMYPDATALLPVIELQLSILE